MAPLNDEWSYVTVDGTVFDNAHPSRQGWTGHKPSQETECKYGREVLGRDDGNVEEDKKSECYDVDRVAA